MRFVVVLFPCALACAAPHATGEAPRALPTVPTSAPCPSFHGVPIARISGLIVDGHALERASVEDALDRSDAPKALEVLVDDALVHEAATRLNVVVSAEEVERAKRERMRDLGLNDSLWATELARQGVTEEALMRRYRDTLLRAKLSQLVVGPIDVDDDDERVAYADFVRRGSFDVDVQMLAVDAKDENLAASLVTRARAGEDFCKLVATYSVDATKADCGSRGPLPTTTLIPEVSQVLSKMRDGAVSEPLAISDKLVVIRLRRRLVPTFEAVRAQMHDVAFEARETRLYAIWLGEARAHARVEVLSRR